MKKRKYNLSQAILVLIALLITALVLFIELELVSPRFHIVVAVCLVLLLTILVAKERT